MTNETINQIEPTTSQQNTTVNNLIATGIDMQENDEEIFCIDDIEGIKNLSNGIDNSECHGFFIKKTIYQNRPADSKALALVPVITLCGIDIKHGKLSVLTTTVNTLDVSPSKYSILFGSVPTKKNMIEDLPALILSESNPLTAMGVSIKYLFNKQTLTNILIDTINSACIEQLGVDVSSRDKINKFPSFFFLSNNQQKENAAVVFSVPLTMRMSEFNDIVNKIKVAAGGIPPYNINVLELDLNEIVFEPVSKMTEQELTDYYSRHIHSKPYEEFKKKLIDEKEYGVWSYIVLENLIFSIVMRIQMVLDYSDISELLLAQEDKFV